MDIINKGDYVLTDQEVIDYMQEIAADKGQDLMSMTTNQFTAILQQTQRRFFEHSNMILDNNTGDILDYNIIYNLVDLYIFLCMSYNKVISTYGFSCLCGIEYMTLESYGGYNINSKQFNLYKRLKNTREDYIKNKLVDSNNVVGAIAVANNEYKWTSPDTGSSTTINIIGGSELPSMIEALNSKGLSVPTIPNNAITNDHAVNSYQ